MSMEINSAYGSILQNYRIPTIPSVSVEQVKEQDRQLAASQNVPVHIYEEPSVPEIRKPDARLEDVSVTFNKQDDFGYIGQDSDIRSLDVEKAISDMRKDQVLQQYQYFVGSSRNLYEQQGQPMDGIVVPKF